jgi:hypothetical protein
MMPEPQGLRQTSKSATYGRCQVRKRRSFADQLTARRGRHVRHTYAVWTEARDGGTVYMADTVPRTVRKPVDS